MDPLAEDDPLASLPNAEAVGYDDVLEQDLVQDVVDEADTTTFDNRSEFDDPVQNLDGALSLHGGDATHGDPGLHDLGDIIDFFT